MALLSLYTLLRPRVQTHVAVEQHPTDQTLRKIARDFCKRSEIWRETLEDIETEDGETEYAITMPDNYDTDILRVLVATFNGAVLDPSLYTFRQDNVFIFDNDPAGEYDLSLQVVFKPRETCYQYPDWLLYRHGDAIADGAVGMLRSMAARPWFNPTEAAVYLDRYTRAIGDAKLENIQARQPGLGRAVLKRFV